MAKYWLHLSTGDQVELEAADETEAREIVKQQLANGNLPVDRDASVDSVQDYPTMGAVVGAKLIQITRPQAADTRIEYETVGFDLQLSSDPNAYDDGEKVGPFNTLDEATTKLMQIWASDSSRPHCAILAFRVRHTFVQASGHWLISDFQYRLVELQAMTRTQVPPPRP